MALLCLLKQHEPELAVAEAKARGCYKLIATSRFERERVHKLYEGLGFERWGLEYRMNFGE